MIVALIIFAVFALCIGAYALGYYDGRKKGR